MQHPLCPRTGKRIQPDSRQYAEWVTDTETTKRVAVLGATGKVGGLFVAGALSAGYKLRVLVRSPDKLQPSEHPMIEVSVGDARSYDDVAAIVAGSDVVVSCLGNVGDLLLMEAAANNVLTAAAAQSEPPRCIFISSIGMGDSSWLIGRLLRIIGGKASFEDYDRADARIRAEETVPFVLVRPAALNDKPGTGKYRASDTWKGTFARPIPRADVAKFLVDAVADKGWDRKPGVQIGGKK